MSEARWMVDTVLTGVIAPLGGPGKLSAIDKHPVNQRLWLAETGLHGDEQADKRHHGGLEKALHHYPFDHYALWRDEWQAGETGLVRLTQPGAFGENLSTTGLTEASVCVGDVYRIGGALIQVSQPRQPCWKLNVRFDRADMSRRVQDTHRTGWYYRVLEAGEIGAGDSLERLARPHSEWPIERLLRVLYVERDDYDSLAAMASLAVLTPSWRATAAKRVASRQVESWASRLDTPTAD
ncbi:MOSC domain-containing protein [Paraburkholderia bonniea]|uniref:MOSC domain-containing protein n=1 Tax=Paraburkholderia bonniea TaxID=2152891 RepID=UPI002572822B|nr:MOSC domain-containing protein [Paraburkholderia bonniea]WJF90326.1 MOSC domain-containing protein [Paraburkholderia bonniea]WJF93641.1 MOSC domain-containing protein [Paraburkholderia bonniea]